MRIFTANIKSNPLMRQSRVESDISTAVHLGGIGFWQEIAPKRYKAALARHALEAGLEVYGIGVECPVTLKAANWVVESNPKPHLMHKSRFHITPPRYVVEVRAHEKRKPHVKVCALGTHFISSAWSRNHMLTRAWRRRMWWQHMTKLVLLVHLAHQAGYNVIVGMDANKTITTLRLHPDQVIVSHHGIDGVIVVPAEGMRVTFGDERVVKGLFTDHDPVAVTARVAPK